jgi:BASS family bile acid:Na+ symporter
MNESLMNSIQIFSDVLLPLSLCMLMLGMGLTLTFMDFYNTIRFPKRIITGLSSQIIILPILGFLICLGPGLTNEEKVGIVLLVACPGGVTANFVNYVLRADLALSVSLSTLSAFTSIFTIPVIINLGLYVFSKHTGNIELPFYDTLIEILKFVITPILLGLSLRVYNLSWAMWLNKLLKYINLPVMVIAMIGVLFFEKLNNNQLTPIAHLIHILPYTIILNITSMLIGFFVAKSVSLPIKSALAISVGAGLQNTTLALTIALNTTLLNNFSIAIPALAYATLSLFITFVMGYLLKQHAPGKSIPINP